MTDASIQRGVLVTGAADGIGRGIAEIFARAGDRVALLDFDFKRLDQTVEELRSAGGDVFGVEVDVRDSAAVGTAVAGATERLGQLDVTVSNAGVYPNKPVLEMDEAEW